jgi:hypothetical protein
MPKNVYLEKSNAWRISNRALARIRQELQTQVPSGCYATELEALESLGTCDSTSGSLHRKSCRMSGIHSILHSVCVQLCEPDATSLWCVACSFILS